MTTIFLKHGIEIDEYVKDLEQQKTTSKAYDDMMAKLGKTTREREQQKTVALSR